MEQVFPPFQSVNAGASATPAKHEEHKVTFQFNVMINELSHIPMLHGILFLHWKMGRIEGHSPHFPVTDHQIQFRMSFKFDHALAVDRSSGVLEDALLKIHVNMETMGGQDYVLFGVVTVNLSEFADSKETTRKYLLDQSRTNASLSVTVSATTRSGGNLPFWKVPGASGRFVSLEDEDDAEAHAEGFRAHAVDDVLISDQRYMIRQREFLRTPEHVVATRVPASDVIEDLLSRVKM